MKKTRPAFNCGPDECVKEKTLGVGLAEFAKRYQLSSRKLSAACGGPAAGVSKSSADRICRGVAELRVVEPIRLAILENLRRFLASLGKNEEQIEAELQNIFSTKEITNMIVTRTVLPPDAQRYFGLRFDPFDPLRSPRSTQEVFITPALNAVLDRVLDAINYQGFLAVIGDIGSGKTILKLRIMEIAKESNGKLRLIWPKFSQMERVDPGAIVHTLLECLDQKPRLRLVSSQRQLEQHLEHLHEQGVRVAIGFDECHHLSDATLTALKNFYELGTGGYERYIGIVLFGQTRFVNSQMQNARFQEIVERLDIIHMPKLGKQAGDYIAHRIKLAGGDADKLFDRAAITALVTQASTPLALGNLANAALIKAHQLGEKKVLASFVNKPSSEPSVLAVRRAS